MLTPQAVGCCEPAEQITMASEIAHARQEAVVA